MKQKKKKEVSKKSRRRVIVEWGVQLLLLLVVLVGITAWQTRDMVTTGESAPAIELQDLQGKPASLTNDNGKKVVLYFFAPWCSVCHASSSNINDLRDAYSEEDLAIYAVGLGWDSVQELHQFAREHRLTVPVLVGNKRIAAAYRISSFPSVYILDEQHRIAHQLVGYTTALGLRLRTALTGVL